MADCCKPDPAAKPCCGDQPAKPGPKLQIRAIAPQNSCCQDNTCGQSPDTPLAALAAAEPVAGGIRTAIRIMQMDCPTEEGMIRKKLGSMAAVKALEFNLMQRVLTVTHTPDGLEPVLAAIHALGFTPELPDASGKLAAPEAPRRTPWLLVAALVAALGAEVVHWLAWPEWLSALLACAAIFSGGLTTYRKGWIALRNGNLNINALMSIAVTGALLLGQWPEAAMVMVLFTIAELIEANSLDRARNAISGLLALAPEQATVQQADGSWQTVAASAVTIGARVRLRPGERIALDGTVVSGHSSVDQAPITGESLPVEKGPGDNLYAGTINQAGTLEYQVSAGADNTTLARIIHAVEKAQGSKAPIQRFVDRFARIYTPMVFAAALLVALCPPLLLGASWQEWIYKALVLLVIACPCALVISTPVTIVSALAAAARRGILITGGAYLEQGRKLTTLALDKTGTLTHGQPAVLDLQPLGNQPLALCRQLACSLAQHSDHPVSMAIAKEGAAQGVTTMATASFEALPGLGIRGTLGDQRYWLGNHRLIHDLGICSAELEQRLDSLERQGRSVVLLCDQQQVLALYSVADTVRPQSRQAVAELHQLGVRTLMLSGDNPHTVEAIAATVGIDEARGNLLPDDKLAVIRSLSEQQVVGMVGDGINDAPALAQAHIGIAMAQLGSDTAIETADVALMDDDLRKIPAFIRLSRTTHAILLQNMVLALGLKGLFLVLTLLGLGTMWMAVFADVGASLLVVGNGLRLLRK